MVVKSQLIKNGFKNDTISTFMQEFERKNVTGKDLQQFKRNSQLLDAFQMSFSKTNQTLSIWLVISSIINDIRFPE